MGLFTKTVNCFHKELHNRYVFMDSPKFVSDWEIHFLNTKTKTMYIKLKLHTYISFCSMSFDDSFRSDGDVFIEIK